VRKGSSVAELGDSLVRPSDATLAFGEAVE
jgi:hypothetical protein